jgi:hypothetical protein
LIGPHRAMLGATRKWAEDLTHTLTDGTPIPDEVRKIVDAAFEFSATIADSAREFAKAVMTSMTGQRAEPTAPKSGVPRTGRQATQGSCRESPQGSRCPSAEAHRRLNSHLEADVRAPSRDGVRAQILGVVLRECGFVGAW